LNAVPDQGVKPEEGSGENHQEIQEAIMTPDMLDFMTDRQTECFFSG